MLVTNDLAFCFAHVFGGDVAPDKTTAMRSFLADAGNGYGRRCAADYDEAAARQDADPASTVLITDTAGDVKDARAVGIRAVGVAWGMHSVEELMAAGAEFVALWPQEITAHLLGDAAARPPRGACAVPAVHRPRSEPDASVSGAPPALAEAARPGGCGCGCDGTGCPVSRFVGERPDPVRRAAAVRRRRRTEAVAVVEAADPGHAHRVPADRAPVDRAQVDRAPAGRATAAAARAPGGRNPAAHPAPAGPGPSAELLAAVRRVCGG